MVRGGGGVEGNGVDTSRSAQACAGQRAASFAVGGEQLGVRSRERAGHTCRGGIWYGPGARWGARAMMSAACQAEEVRVHQIAQTRTVSTRREVLKPRSPAEGSKSNM